MLNQKKIMIDNEPSVTRLSGTILKIAVTLAILIIGAIGISLLLKSKPTAQPVKTTENIPAVDTLTVHTQNIQLPITVSGIVEAADVRQISANISGSILAISPNLAASNRIKKGEWLIKVDTSQLEPELSHARAQLAGAQAAYKTAKLTAENNKAALKELGINASNNPPQLIEAQAHVNSARQQLQVIQKRANNSVMYAPFNAKILKRIVNISDLISIGLPIAQTLSSEKVIAKLSIADKELALLDTSTFTQGKQLSARFTDSNNNHQWSGVIIGSETGTNLNNQFNYLISQIYQPTLEDSTQSLANEISIGQTIQTSLQSKLLNNVISLPSNAIRNGNQVWLFNAGKLDIKDIQIIYRGKNTVYANDGIPSGSAVITSNINLPVDGMKLKKAR